MNTKKIILDPRQVLFGTIFPESQGFRSNLSAEATHCIMRAMCHISGNGTRNTYPSTKDGVLLPFNVNVAQ